MIRRLACLAVLVAGTATVGAQAPQRPIKLTLRPAAAPTPALKYVLLPELADTQPGNAALHYQRAHSFEWWGNIRRMPYYNEISEWMDRPLVEIRDKIDFVRNFGALKEVDLGARRQHCNWEMTERVRKEGIGMLVPDVQGFREYAVLLAMRCRLNIADANYSKALYTLQTGLALGRDVSQAPTLINALVGNAICTTMLGRVEELMQAPDAPNLYWAMTDLPRPLIDLRKALQGEKMMLETEFPNLKDLENGPLSPQAQQRILKKVILLHALAGSSQKLKPVPLALKAYPAAKRALIAQGRKPEEVAALPVLQVILIDGLQQYQRVRDDYFKWASLPYLQARAGWKKADAELRRIAREHPGATLFLAFVPHLQTVPVAMLRLDRRVAALRCIEAIRLYAAAHDGKLPAKLGDITEVPVPNDPVTGKNFVYQVKGDRVTLRDPPLADGQPALRFPLHYELTFKR